MNSPFECPQNVGVSLPENGHYMRRSINSEFHILGTSIFPLIDSRTNYAAMLERVYTFTIKSLLLFLILWSP